MPEDAGMRLTELLISLLGLLELERVQRLPASTVNVNAVSDDTMVRDHGPELPFARPGVSAAVVFGSPKMQRSGGGGCCRASSTISGAGDTGTSWTAQPSAPGAYSVILLVGRLRSKTSCPSSRLSVRTSRWRRLSGVGNLEGVGPLLSTRIAGREPASCDIRARRASGLCPRLRSARRPRA
jgi:hypothetical protein